MITVVLLALLLLVLVSTATLTRIETSIGFNSRRESQAKQNALFALNRAIGELQRHAGPDRRVTATAAITGETINAHWTGVWNATVDSALRTWLVSGNEDTADGDGPVHKPSLARFQQLPGSSSWDALNAPGTTGANTNKNYYRNKFRLGGDTPAALLVGPYTTHYGVATDAETRYVLAPLVEVEALPAEGGAEVTVGRYAWWVGDEGVKASITETERHNSLDKGVDFYAAGRPADGVPAENYTDPNPANGNRDRIAQLAQPRQRIEPILTNERPPYDDSDDPLADDTSEQLSRVLGPAQLPFVRFQDPDDPWTASKDFYIDVAESRRKFHDVTVWSRGVLADPSAGGLKDDLSDPLAATVDALDLRLAGFLRLRPDPVVASAGDKYAKVAAYPVGRVDPDGSTAADDYWIAPVISEFRVILANPRIDAGTVLVTWTWEIELWNPYNVELDLGELHVSFDAPENLSTAEHPETKIDWFYTIAGVAGQDKLVALPSGANDPWEADIPGGGVLEPGHILVVGKSADARVLDAAGNMIPGTGPPTIQTFLFPPPTEPIEVTLRDPAGEPIAVYVAPFAPAAGTAGAAIQFRLRDGTDNEDWLLKYDPRAPEFRYLPFSPYFDDPVDPLDPNPPDVRMSGLVAEDKVISPGSSEIPKGALVRNSRMRVFDLPRQEQISIGALHHFAGTPTEPTENLPAFKLGLPKDASGPAGGLENELFDRAFFSTIPRDEGADWDPATEPLPNTRIETYNPDPSSPATKEELVALGADGASDKLPASRLLVHGAFNLNSTSADAWRALTSGTAYPTWPYWFGATPPAVSLERAFFRFTHTGQDLGWDYADKPSPTDSWRQGVRDLTTQQASGIASYIAQHVGDPFDDINGVFIKSAGEPFRSVADFVNACVVNVDGDRVGFLQDAIDQANGRSINSGLYPLAPSYVTQADLLTAWAPFLQARSDTFLIRTYGEAVNPVTGITEARAWCEAVVQRVPDKVDGTDPTTNATGFGRRFKIVQFRWLSPADI